MEDDGAIRFREFEVDPRRFQILRSGVPLAIEPRVCDLILYLIRNRDRMVTRDELLEKVWQQNHVSDSAVARCVSAARKAFGDPECIQSVYGRGYRWVIPIAATRRPRPAETPATRSPPSLLGRDRELHLAERLVERAVGGVGGVYLVSGEPGIGKTRLLGTVRDIAREHGMRVAFHKSRETDGTPPYWPWPRIVAMLYGDSGQFPEATNFLLSSTEEGPRKGRATIESRILVWEAFAESIRDRAREMPTAIFIDDLHEADVGSAYLFEFVAEQASAAPLVLVGAYRPLELERDRPRSACVQRIVRGSSPLAVELRGLSLDDTETLLTSQSGVAPKPEVVRRTHELTGGNPFFLGLLVPLLGTSDAWDGKDVVQRLPSTVRKSIETQLKTLSPSCRSLLSAAAVMGPVVSYSLVAAVLDRAAAAISNDMEEARLAGLLWDGPGAGHTFAFVHDLVREVIYESLTRSEQAELHIAVARVLEAREGVDDGERLAAIAHHYAHAVASGGAERAIDYALRAATSALAKFAYEAAREHLARAIVLMEQSSSCDRRSLCTVLVDLATAELNAGNERAAWAAFARAWDLARELGDSEPLVRMAVSLTASIHTTDLDYDAGLVRLLEELLARTDRSEPRVRALLLSRLIFTIAWLPEQPRRAALAREAHELSQRVADPKVQSSVAVAGYLGLPQPGDLAERLRHAENAFRLCQAAGDLEISQLAHVMFILSLLEAGRLDEAREHIRGCRAVIYRLRTRAAGNLSAPICQAGLLAHIDGRLHDLEEIAHEMAELAERTGSLMPTSLASIERALLALERGLPDVAADEAREWATVYRAAIFVCFFCMTLVRAGRPSEARTYISDFAKTQFDLQKDFNWLCSMAFLAQACAELGEREWATILYDRLLPYEDRCVTIGAACGYLGSVQRYLGLLAAVTGHTARADAHFERANEVHSKIGARLMLAHSLCDHALFLERAGAKAHRERALARRRAATELSDELGAGHLQKKLAISPA